MSVVLFYSSQCAHSKRFLSLLDKLNVRKYFKLISVDKVNGQRPAVVAQYGIREVPTIVAKNQKLSGDAAFRWLNSALQEFTKGKAKAGTGFGGGGGGGGPSGPGGGFGGGVTVLEPMDMSGGLTGGGGLGTSFSGPGYCTVGGGLIDNNAFVGANEGGHITAQVDARNFKKPEGLNFQLPTGITAESEALWKNRQSINGNGSGSGRSGTSMDYQQMMAERERQDKASGGFRRM